VRWDVATRVTVCRCCAAGPVRIKCKSKNLFMACEVASVRAGCWQVIDVLAIVVENGFEPNRGQSNCTTMCSLRPTPDYGPTMPGDFSSVTSRTFSNDDLKKTILEIEVRGKRGVDIAKVCPVGFCPLRDFEAGPARRAFMARPAPNLTKDPWKIWSATRGSK
jgi:hypothetical protein